ncbi:coiled-coil domain-containing protein 112-like [Daphnia carinata]|uniref:coiled-coil domain-containing protein 112-like n=1 Tax=Daphnia carinata TaxID=120202 RepID=UPI00257D5E86|nr:coiled-coil domain-containing protein 112-like [Daphnia carinata]
MEDLRYEGWSIGRQLNVVYESLEEMCGIHVAAVDISRSRPTLVNDQTEEHLQQLLEGLHQQEGLLRQQIRDLIAKLPVRSIDEAVTNGTAAPAAEALRHFLVSNGGETGGWDPRDHGLFLQWRSRFRNNRQTFVSAVCDTVPGKNPAQVEAHEKWYQNLQRLRREQRQELDNWKREKRKMEEEERKRIASQQHESDAWVDEWRRQRESVRERLDRWKETKARKAAEDPSEETMDEERKKAEAEQKRRMDHQYQKLVAYLWRMEQEAAKMASETADDYLARLVRKQKSLSSDGQLMTEQRQQRDREWLEHRRRQLLARQQQQPKVAPLRRAVSVPRDPQRLLRPTSAFMARLLPATDGQSSGRPTDSYILNVQSKTVPSWRQLSTD